LEVVKALLAAQADVNKADNGGQTPLYRASFNGHLEVVKALLAAQADVNKAR
jgi:ankyrin repeat protein